MKLVTRGMEKDAAMDLMAELVAAGKSPEIRYHPDGRGSTTNEYAVYLPDNQIEEERPDAEDDGLDDVDAAHESILSCPRCGGRRVSYPEDRGLWVAFVLTLPLLCIPAFIYGTYTAAKGTRKRCETCHHMWRSKP